MSEEDKELDLLKAKRLLEMKKNISLQQKKEELKATKQEQKASTPNPREILIKQRIWLKDF